MPTYRDEGVVLRTHRLGEADRIITVFTREHGKVRAVAKGVRRTKSRFGARLEPFSHIDLQCHIGRNLDTVTEVSVHHAYGTVLAAHWPAWTAGCAMLEAADKITSEDREPQVQQYRLLVAALNALSKAEHDADLILDAYLLRACAVAGYAPALAECVACAVAGDVTYFHVQSGGVMCAACKAPGAAVLTTATRELMASLLGGDWATADAAGVSERRAASGFIAAHLQWNLDRSLRTLDAVDRSAAMSSGEQPPERESA